MIIWRNEMTPDSAVYSGAQNAPVGVTIVITRTEQRGEFCHIWFAPVPATKSPAAADEDIVDAIRMYMRRRGMRITDL